MTSSMKTLLYRLALKLKLVLRHQGDVEDVVSLASKQEKAEESKKGKPRERWPGSKRKHLRRRL